MRTGQPVQATRSMRGRMNWYRRIAQKAEMKRREALKQELEKRNAQLQRDIGRPSHVFDEGAVAVDELAASLGKWNCLKR